MKRSSIKINAFLNAFRNLINILFPLITFKYASYILKAPNLGKVNFSSSIISYFVLIADFGIATYAAREGAKYRSNYKLFNTFASEIYSINIISTLISYILLFLLLFNWPKLYVYKWILFIQSISLIFTAVGATWVNIVNEDYKSILIRSLTVQFISLILLFLLVHDKEAYHQYALVSVIAQSGANLINAFYIKKYCTLRFKLSKVIWKHVKPLLIMFGISVTTTIYVNSDTTMLGIFKTDADVAYYSVAVKIYNVIKSILAAVIIVGIPKLTELYFNENKGEYKSFAVNILNMLLTFMLPLIAGVFVLSKEAILLISGVEYLQSVMTLRLLCFAVLFALLASYITNIVILPQGLEKGSLIAAAMSAIVNILLNIYAVPKFGFNGAAVTTVISELLVFIIEACYVVKLEKDNIKLLINKSVLKNISKTIMGVALFVFIDSLIMQCNINMIYRCLIIVCTSVIVYLVSMVLMGQEIVIQILKFLQSYRKRGVKDV